MTIKISQGPYITLSREEHEILSREWQAFQRMTISPVSFEMFVNRLKRLLGQGLTDGS